MFFFHNMIYYPLFCLKHDLEFLVYNCYKLFLNFNYLHINLLIFLEIKNRSTSFLDVDLNFS